MDYTLGCAEKPMTEKHFAEKMENCIACCAKEMPADTAATLKVLIDHIWKHFHQPTLLSGQ